MTDQIDNYKIHFELGSGSFGSVYVASQLRTDKLVALKLLHQLDDDALKRFHREIEILSELRGHPSIVAILSSGMYGTQPYYVMEYCSQGSLRNFIGLANPALAMLALQNVALGLQSLNNLGGFHRDIKPDNMLLMRDLEGNVRVKLSDFGLARRLETSYFTNRAGGTWVYMSPQAQRDEPYTISDDVYSLGLSVIELLSGSRNPDFDWVTDKGSELEKRLRPFLQRLVAQRAESRPDVDRIIKFVDITNRIHKVI